MNQEQIKIALERGARLNEILAAHGLPLISVTEALRRARDS